MATPHRDADGDLDINAFARHIAPGLVAEMGRWPTSNDIVAYLDQQDIAPHLSIGELELLVDELKDLAPTYTLTVS